jgi:hypothetical protein
MKRFLTIIFAIAIFVACNPNKRIVSTVPIKTNVLGIELCKQMTEDEIVDILEENSNSSLWDVIKLKNRTSHIFESSSEYHSIEYGGLMWDYICIDTSEEFKVCGIQLQSAFESIETAKRQYDSAIKTFSQKYGNGNSFERGIFWTDDTNTVAVELMKGKGSYGAEGYYCILTYRNNAAANEIITKEQSDI